ncbi:MAG: gliding motility protein GldC [Flavobacteriales bacterium]|nr:gliding motility protein GldC [Flavobacteriales bacterium]
MKTSDIQITIALDENHVPETMSWSASDGEKDVQTKAIILALWEKDMANTARIDLWTKDMHVDEMKQFVHQTILTLADSFQKATGETAMAATMRDFCEYFAEKMNIIAPAK